MFEIVKIEEEDLMKKYVSDMTGEELIRVIKQAHFQILNNINDPYGYAKQNKCQQANYELSPLVGKKASK